ncbi:MAG: phosphoesterase, partial [Gammaproteobacteria bacterium]|nr:phosphoesterase [Gammaproteobacteria bacterium]
PGHQAAALNPDGSLDPGGARGAYRNYPTLGGFDQFTAIVGGFWDSMLAEGRRWWITANSDSHRHYSEGGSDFWPGEYSKTYVWADRSHDAILDSIRNGRIFVTTGDLISELHFTVSDETEGSSASLGDTLEVDGAGALEVTIRFRDPNGFNNNGDYPSVARVDLIQGEITGPASDRTQDTNNTTRVIARFNQNDWSIDGEYREITYTLDQPSVDSYLRIRGTNGTELNPLPDPRGEDPWSDLWFYSNPVFIELR